MSVQDFGHLCRGRRIHTSGHHPDFGILSNLGAYSNFTKVYADIASAACPSQAGCLAMTSITFAAVIWDADEPCSVKKLRRLQSCLYQCHHGARLCFCTSEVCVLTPRFWGGISPSMQQSWTLFLSICPSNMTSFLLLTFPLAMLESFRASSIPCPLLLLHPVFSTLVAQDKLVNQIVMGHRSKSFTCNVIFVLFR